ncbi:hypothetical protein Q7P37_002456 [Cladosporium fusiforme]
MDDGRCTTEVLLPNLPLTDRHARLHRYLPSSPYSHGAIYTPLRDDPESPLSRRSGPQTTNRLPSAILLLRGEFKWRFGGRVEQESSPPWTWRSEELCGKPYPYYARDLHCLDSAARPKLHPHYSAAYMVRISFSSPGMRDYLEAAQMHHLCGWASEDFYDCKELGRNPGVPGALRYVCVQSFDVRVHLDKVAIIVSQTMSQACAHKPHLQWYMGTYELEGSMAHESVADDVGGLSSADCRSSDGRRSVHCPPTDSLVKRRQEFSPRVSWSGSHPLPMT